MFLPTATYRPLAGSVIFTPSDVCCCGKALPEVIQIANAKTIMITENMNLSNWLKVLRERKLEEVNSWQIWKIYTSLLLRMNMHIEIEMEH